MEKNKEQVRELWERCFHDSGRFLELYFGRVYREENTLVGKEGGKVVSALQMLPYRMTYGSREIPVAYISGASTYPYARGKGWMKGLLLQAFGEMRRRGQLLSVLIPAEEWLFGFYHKAGYAEGMYYRPMVCPTGKSTAGAASRCSLLRLTDRLLADEEQAFTPVRLYAYFERSMKERPYAVQHDRDDFGNILQDLLISGGDLFVAVGRAQEINGMAFVYPLESDTVCIKELLADDEEIRNFLLDFLPSYYPHQTTVWREAASSGTPYGMIRVIDAEAMLSRYAELHPDVSLLLNLKDDQLPFNTGYYTLRHGLCRREPDSFEDPTVLQTTMPELVPLLFSGHPVGLTLMLE